MRSILLKRPRERFYNENRFRVYLNGKFVAKLRHDSTVEINGENDEFELQIRQGLLRSRKMKFDPKMDRTFEVKMNPVMNRIIPKILPMTPLAMIGFKSNIVWIKYLSILIFAASFIGMFYYYGIVAFRDGIIIEKIQAPITNLTH